MGNIIHNLDNQIKEGGMLYKRFFIFLGTALIFGIIIGFSLSFIQKSFSSSSKSGTSLAKTAGIANKKNFKDMAEGILKEGGVDGEGNFHLERPGGESQNVYLTSTTVDLSKYIGKKVKVWGETFQGEKAGWLMDVGLVEMQ